ncbi:thioredoxin [Bacillaceae bacterium ZC4]|uniref:thioredoxin family protein n=1 Tax=unclassified Aeribacillus TaxID=2640495 RepID=UPI00118B66F7|nr:thioredoxin [Bacillaceae bacterium ZC4]
MIEITKEQLDAISDEEQTIIFLYTPFCGTCKLAKSMLEIVEKIIPSINIYTKDLNYIPEFAKKWKIESVPCLLIFEKGQIAEKIYAFHSIDYLYQKLKSFSTI